MERYVVRGQDDKLEVQQRQRESWRAPDGWTWARQTGDDAGRFIFKPYNDWRPIRDASPTVPDLKRSMQRMMHGVPRSEVADAEFSFAIDLLGVETLPADSLPGNYRRALVEALDGNPGVTVTEHVPDPRGRDSIRITMRDADDQTDIVTRSLYLDSEYRYLANEARSSGSGEHGARIVIVRRQTDAIPRELLTAVGNKRVEKAEWR